MGYDMRDMKDLLTRPLLYISSVNHSYSKEQVCTYGLKRPAYVLLGKDAIYFDAANSWNKGLANCGHFEVRCCFSQTMRYQHNY